MNVPVVINDVGVAAGRMGEFDIMLVWSLDRLSREGPEAMLSVLRRFREVGVTIESLQEPWVNGTSEMQELLASTMGWMAGVESSGGVSVSALIWRGARRLDCRLVAYVERKT